MLSKNINLALIVDSMLFQSQAITLSHSHSSKAFLLEVGFADEPQFASCTKEDSQISL